MAELAEAAPERAAIATWRGVRRRARAIGDPHARAHALVDLSEPREALAAARAIPDDVSQVPGSPYTFQPSAVREDALKRIALELLHVDASTALDVAREIGDPDRRIEVLAAALDTSRTARRSSRSWPRPLAT